MVNDNGLQGSFGDNDINDLTQWRASTAVIADNPSGPAPSTDVDIVQLGVNASCPALYDWVVDAIKHLIAGSDMHIIGPNSIGKTIAICLYAKHFALTPVDAPVENGPRVLILTTTHQGVDLLTQMLQGFKGQDGHLKIQNFHGDPLKSLPAGTIDQWRAGLVAADIGIACLGRLSADLQSQRITLDDTRLLILDDATSIIHDPDCETIIRALQGRQSTSTLQMIACTSSPSPQVTTLLGDHKTTTVGDHPLQAKLITVSMVHLPKLQAETIVDYIKGALAKYPATNTTWIMTETRDLADAVGNIFGGDEAAIVHGGMGEAPRALAISQFMQGKKRKLITTAPHLTYELNPETDIAFYIMRHREPSVDAIVQAISRVGDGPSGKPGRMEILVDSMPAMLDELIEKVDNAACRSRLFHDLKDFSVPNATDANAMPVREGSNSALNNPPRQASPSNWW